LLLVISCGCRRGASSNLSVGSTPPCML
jgi:hypothetical protein